MGTWLPCREKEVYSESLFLISCFHGDPLGRHFVFLAFQAKGEQEFINHLQDSDTKAFLISRTNFWWWTSYPASCRNSVSIFTSEISSVLMFVSPEPALCQKHETTMKVCRRVHLCYLQMKHYNTKLLSRLEDRGKWLCSRTMALHVCTLKILTTAYFRHK